MEINELKNILKDKIKRAYIIVFSALAVFAYFLLARHDMGVFYGLRNTINVMEKNLNTLKAISAYTKYTDKFNSGFCMENNTHLLIEIVTEAAKARSVALTLVRPLETTHMSGYRKISINVEGEAPYDNLGYFISDLENSRNYLFIEEFNLGKGYEYGTGGKRTFRRDFSAQRALPVISERPPFMQNRAGNEGLLPMMEADMLREGVPVGPEAFRRRASQNTVNEKRPYQQRKELPKNTETVGSAESIATFKLVVTGFYAEK
ncbi:MAG: hypothetical protein JW994_06490 [Candidatus Omnitrophica bacterium]|nr:hypothetical protein [Candidatus Omnitrophota bacterium]